MEKQLAADVELLESGSRKFSKIPNGKLPEILPVTDAQVKEAAVRISNAYLKLSTLRGPFKIGEFVELL